MDGIDKAINDLKRMKENLKKVEGKHNYTFAELFTEDFMNEYTDFSSINDFFKNSGFDFSSQEAFRNIDVQKLDEYISCNSKFSSWEEMLSKASKILLEKKIYE